MESLSEEEIQRYSRHLVMPEVGIPGQSKLKGSSVLVVGAGGLGTPASAYLAAAGVGRIGLVDFDVVELTNLQRQIMYSEVDVGKPKAEVLRARLLQINPNVTVDVYPVRLDSSNAMEILGPYDIVVDGSDNLPTRYLVNDACAFLGKPDVYASIYRFDGQATVFDAKNGPCYRCLFPQPPPPDSVPSCAEAGVFGVLPGVMGSIQAVQAIGLILNTGDALQGRLLLFNALDSRFTELRIKKNPECPVCGAKPTIRELIDYEEFCGLKEESTIPEIGPVTLKEWMDTRRKILLLDVREPVEYQICHLQSSRLVPLGTLTKRKEELDRNAQIVVYCHTGVRSLAAAKYLKLEGFKDVSNLKGGIKAWAEQVEPAMARY